MLILRGVFYQKKKKNTLGITTIGNLSVCHNKINHGKTLDSNCLHMVERPWRDCIYIICQVNYFFPNDHDNEINLDNLQHK